MCKKLITPSSNTQRPSEQGFSSYIMSITCAVLAYQMASIESTHSIQQSDIKQVDISYASHLRPSSATRLSSTEYNQWWPSSGGSNGTAKAPEKCFDTVWTSFNAFSACKSDVSHMWLTFGLSWILHLFYRSALGLGFLLDEPGTSHTSCAVYVLTSHNGDAKCIHRYATDLSLPMFQQWFTVSQLLSQWLFPHQTDGHCTTTACTCVNILLQSRGVLLAKFRLHGTVCKQGNQSQQ